MYTFIIVVLFVYFRQIFVTKIFKPWLLSSKAPRVFKQNWFPLAVIWQSKRMFMTSHAYIHNWPLQTFSQEYGLASQTTDVVCFNFNYVSGGSYSLTSTPNDRFIRNFLMAGLNKQFDECSWRLMFMTSPSRNFYKCKQYCLHFVL